MAERILVADDDPDLRLLLTTMLERHGFEVITVPNGNALVRTAREILPDLLLIDVMMPVMDGLEAIRQLRQDTRTGHLPMLLLTAQATDQHVVQGLETGADDYITKPFSDELLIARVKANLRRAARMPVNNPLTGMPGNLLIAEEVNYRLRNGRPFALLWIDIDHFKSFNDAYGFARGDHVLRLLGGLLAQSKHERSNDEDFVGHIGGDDFVVLTNPPSAREICGWLIEHFDAVVGDFYDPKDVERGYLTSLDRFGTPRRFPLLSLSIGVVDTSRREFTSYDQVSTVAAEVKRFAKKMVGSTYAFDERQRFAPLPVAERRGQPPLVGIVCDDKDLYVQVSDVISRTGSREKRYQVDVTVESILHDRPELIILEGSIPQSWVLLDALHTAATGVPIITITCEPGDRERAIAAGAAAAVPRDLAAGQLWNVTMALLRLDESRISDKSRS